MATPKWRAGFCAFIVLLLSFFGGVRIVRADGSSTPHPTEFRILQLWGQVVLSAPVAAPKFTFHLLSGEKVEVWGSACDLATDGCRVWSPPEAFTAVDLTIPSGVPVTTSSGTITLASATARWTAPGSPAYVWSPAPEWWFLLLTVE